MTSRLSKLLTAADGRYLTPDERAMFEAYAASVSRRLGIGERVEAEEHAVLTAVIDEMQRKYPNFAQQHDQGWARCFRDLQLTLRQDVLSMQIDDLPGLDDRLLFWLRTMFAASNLTPQFCRDLFTLLRDRMRERLGSEEFDLLAPYLDRNVAVMADFPEPLTPAV